MAKPTLLAARAQTPSGRETRTFTVAPLESRAGSDGAATLTLDGYACVTETPYTRQDWLGEYTEVVRTGAFAKTLAESDDVRLLLNHEGLPLARTRSGTLRLAEVIAGEVTGLHCEADLDPASSLVADIASAMRRGDLDQMSFCFTVTRQQWSPDFAQRDILEVRLFDVAVVTFPSNPATTVSLRAALAGRLGEHRADILARAHAELREGKTLSASTLEVLTQVLDLVAAADTAVDEAQPLLADLMGVPNPDDDDEAAGAGTDSDSQANAAPVLGLALARAHADVLRARA